MILKTKALFTKSINVGNEAGKCHTYIYDMLSAEKWFGWGGSGWKDVEKRLDIGIEIVSQIWEVTCFIVFLLYCVGFVYTFYVCSLPVCECITA